MAKPYTWEMLQSPAWDRARDQVVEAFRRKVWRRPVDGCWIWTGAYNENDYGLFSGPWLKEMAHRLSYEIDVGLLGKDGVACHRCDTPPCVSPSHLFRGSLSLNTLDKYAKGREKSNFEIRNSRKIGIMNLIGHARLLRWTTDLLTSSSKGCEIPSLSGDGFCPRGCARCRRRHQVIGIHMTERTSLDSVDKKDPLYLLRILPSRERDYVEEAAGE